MSSSIAIALGNTFVQSGAWVDTTYQTQWQRSEIINKRKTLPETYPKSEHFKLKHVSKRGRVGLRRCIQVAVSPEAWVRIPALACFYLSPLFVFAFYFLACSFVFVLKMFLKEGGRHSAFVNVRVCILLWLQHISHIIWNLFLSLQYLKIIQNLNFSSWNI